jgi:hypothetical protein
MLDDEPPPDLKLRQDVAAILGFNPFVQDEALAMDRSVRTFDANGHLHVGVSNISKANVCDYYGHEIPDGDKMGLDPKKVYKLYRDPAELAKAVKTFNGLPILKKHQPVAADQHPTDLVVGSTGNDAQFINPYMRNSLTIWDRAAIDGIQNNDRRELSAAYRYRADMRPGVANGQRYDGVMRDIAGNHVALVPEGRVGGDAVVADEKPRSMRMARKLKMTKQGWAKHRPRVIAAMNGFAEDASLADFANFLDVINGTPAGGDLPEGAGGPMEGRELEEDQADPDDPTSPPPEAPAAEPVEEIEEFGEGGPIEAEGPGEEPPGEVEEVEEDHGGLPEQIAAKLEEWLSPEQMAELRQMAGGGAEGTAQAEQGDEAADAEDEDVSPGNPGDLIEETTESDMPAKIPTTGGARDASTRHTPEMPKKIPTTSGARDRGGQHAKPRTARDEAITKTAMDEAIAAERKRFHACREAERIVRPYIGDLAKPLDNPHAIIKLALDSVGEDVTGIHPSAWQRILEMHPKPGDQRQPVSRAAVAMDEKDRDSFAQRFPTFGRLKHA